MIWKIYELIKVDDGDDKEFIFFYVLLENMDRHFSVTFLLSTPEARNHPRFALWLPVIAADLTRQDTITRYEYFTYKT